MKTLTKEDCLELLKKYKVPEGIIRHSVAVNKVAMFIAKELIKKGEKIDLGLLNCASLLHDIAKHECLDKGKDHCIEGCNILVKEGYGKIASVVRAHMFDEVFGGPKTWEEKIIFYADKRVNPEGIVNVKDRFDYAKRKYTNKIKSINKTEKLTYKLEKEIFSKIDVSPEDLLKLK